MKVIPLGKRLFVRQLTEEEATLKTESGIIIPDSQKRTDLHRYSVVIDVGPGVESAYLKKGANIFLTGMLMKEEVNEGDKTIGFLINESDVLAVLEDIE